MSKNQLPCVYIYSCCDDDPLKTIKSIRNEENLEIDNYENEDILCNRWEINCKYYTAEVQFCTSKSLEKLSDDFIKNINAIILLFDAKKENVIDSLNRCMPLVNQSQAEVLIVLSEKLVEYDSSNNPNQNSKLIFDWCQKYHFELVMLEEEADEMDTVGIERVRHALFAHYWPNLKPKCEITHPSTKAIIEDSVVDSQLSGGMSDLKMDIEDGAELDSNLFSEMFEGDVNFFNTFDKVQKLKQQISSMPDEERKVAAENALTECWKTFFGDDIDL
ncbi:uncharacterized protein LOC126833566 [Adelges cooleyi]|uniref:uncharacterized protein LOC126833566 n=1 Tax=Adelges cooleyi TaxID=133065 RepID=UPI00217F6950|nr:uncharacterized protein LOC126833566 [Adelges cooleyi]